MDKIIEALRNAVENGDFLLYMLLFIIIVALISLTFLIVIVAQEVLTFCKSIKKAQNELAIDDCTDRSDCCDKNIHIENKSVTSARISEPLSFSIDSDTVTIRGDGRITKEFIKSIPCKPKAIIIQEGITSIEYNAFSNYDFLETVQLPNSLTSIEDFLFSGLGRLKGIVIPRGVTRIGKSAFSCCIALEYAIIPNTVESIEKDAFCGCGKLKEIVIPDSVKEIGRGAFESCSELTITVPSSVTHIGANAFHSCRKVNILTENE